MEPRRLPRLLEGLLPTALLAWAAVATVPGVTAGSADAPELSDPAGDTQLWPQGPAPFGDNVDILAAWVGNETATSVDVVLKVKDLSKVTQTDVGVQADTMYVLFFTLDEARPEGRGAHRGEWYVRADYVSGVGSAGHWKFWAEAPCLEFHADGSCPGDKRDIVDDGTVSGEASFAASTVTLRIPKELLGNPQAGDRMAGLRAAVQMVYPTWPGNVQDWDTDQQETAQYRFTWGAVQATSAPASPVNGGSTSASPSSAGGSASAGSGGSASDESAEGAPAEPERVATDPVRGVGAPARSAPDTGAALGVTLLALAVLRRR